MIDLDVQKHLLNVDIIYTVLYGHSPETATARWWKELARMRGQENQDELQLTEFEKKMIHLERDRPFYIKRQACYDLPAWLGFQHGFKFVERLNDKRSSETLVELVEMRVKNNLPVVLTYREPTRDLHMWDITRLFMREPVKLTFYQRVSQLSEFIYDAHQMATMLSQERETAKTLWWLLQQTSDIYQQRKSPEGEKQAAEHLDVLEFKIRDLRIRVHKRFGPEGWNPELKKKEVVEQPPSPEDIGKLLHFKNLATVMVKEGTLEEFKAEDYEPLQIVCKKSN
jgi:hypothetical protein